MKKQPTAHLLEFQQGSTVLLVWLLLFTDQSTISWVSVKKDIQSGFDGSELILQSRHSFDKVELSRKKVAMDEKIYCQPPI